jgi:excisionase family DNA binding protein
VSVLTVDEFAAELRIGRRQAYELVNGGGIRVVRVGRSIRVPRSALAEFLGETTEPIQAQDGASVSAPSDAPSPD